jgi:AcrR family transcriptional regulator
MKPCTRPYHHGNLRQALLRAAEAALEAGGVPQLSLRELSRELGVSHASSQRHFATKQDLLDALAIMGFERLSSAVAKATETRSQDLNARLTKAASAYVGFALKHPALFALMFEAKRRPGMLPELRTSNGPDGGVFAYPKDFARGSRSRKDRRRRSRPFGPDPGGGAPRTGRGVNRRENQRPNA